ncbi:hypothetical protein Tco_1035197 [Tanacetum coccineum]
MLMLKLQRHTISIKIQESRKRKFKDKDFRNSDIKDLPLRYQVYQERLLASFQNDAKYEHVGQDTRSQDGKDDKDKQGKYLKISELKKKSKTMTKAQDQRSQSMKEKAYNMIKTKDSRTQRQRNLNKFKEERFKNSPQEFKDHTLGDIVSLKYVFEHGSSESVGNHYWPQNIESNKEARLLIMEARSLLIIC